MLDSRGFSNDSKNSNSETGTCMGKGIRIRDDVIYNCIGFYITWHTGQILFVYMNPYPHAYKWCFLPYYSYYLTITLSRKGLSAVQAGRKVPASDTVWPNPYTYWTKNS